jgi:hypothetical protein
VSLHCNYYLIIWYWKKYRCTALRNNKNCKEWMMKKWRRKNRNRKKAILIKMVLSILSSFQIWTRTTKKLLLWQNMIQRTGIERFILDLIYKVFADINLAMRLKRWSGFQGIMDNSTSELKFMSSHVHFVINKFRQTQWKTWDTGNAWLK